MFGRECEACGRNIFIGRYVDGFNVCGRCVKVQKQSGVSMADLVAKNVAIVAQITAWRRFRGRVSDALVVLAICAGCYVYYWKPEWIRLSAQVPVTLHVRDVPNGEGNILEVRNDAPKALTNVTVMVTNRRGFPRFGHNISEIAVDETRILSPKDTEMRWIVEKGDKIKVECEPFFPITFTAEELGVK